jgi:hypothetical protein
MAKLYSERLNNLNIKFKSKGIYLANQSMAYSKEENFALMQKKYKEN